MGWETGDEVGEMRQEIGQETGDRRWEMRQEMEQEMGDKMGHKGRKGSYIQDPVTQPYYLKVNWLQGKTHQDPV